MSKKIKKVLITGSSGTIGTRLFETLLEKNYAVVGFDRKANKWSGALNKMTIRGDLLKKADLKKIPSDFDLIIHFAANARVYDLVLEPDLALENIVSTYNMLEFSRKNKIENFMFSGSREIYGNKKKAVSKEGDVDINLCESAYAASKMSDEALVYAFSKCYGINYIILRFSNVYGMYDESDRFVPLLIKKMMKNEDIQIYGRDKLLDFTYIDDCVAGIVKAVENFGKVKNNVFNIAYGRGEKLTDVADMMKKNMKSRSKIFVKNNRQGEVVKFVADTSKAKKLLRYKPKVSVEKGIKLSINWYEKH